jgi:hypothetical protein
VASRLSDTTTLAASAAASGILTLQTWQSNAGVFATSVVAVLATTNIAFIADALRRNRTRLTVTCPVDGCGTQIEMTGATPTQQARLIALATDHSRHGGAL